PSLDFTTSNDRTKRKKIEEIRSQASIEELSYTITQMSLRASGKLDAANVVKDVTLGSLSKATEDYLLRLPPKSCALREKEAGCTNNLTSGRIEREKRIAIHENRTRGEMWKAIVERSVARAREYRATAAVGTPTTQAMTSRGASAATSARSTIAFRAKVRTTYVAGAKNSTIYCATTVALSPISGSSRHRAIRRDKKWCALWWTTDLRAYADPDGINAQRRGSRSPDLDSRRANCRDINHTTRALPLRLPAIVLSRDSHRQHLPGQHNSRRRGAAIARAMYLRDRNNITPDPTTRRRGTTTGLHSPLEQCGSRYSTIESISI
ncbi:hypothetical protein ALC62_11784, partial [Cyphomyrmex costatus]